MADRFVFKSVPNGMLISGSVELLIPFDCAGNASIKLIEPKSLIKHVISTSTTGISYNNTTVETLELCFEKSVVVSRLP